FAAVSEMVEQRERMRLTATKLRCEVEDRGRLGLHPIQPAHGLYSEFPEVLCEERAVEELDRLLVHARRSSISDVVEVDGELGRVEGLAFSQVLARGDDLVPGLHESSSSTLRSARLLLLLTLQTRHR